MSTETDSSYDLDADDTIVATTGDWGLVEEETVGRSIWRYVRGEGLAALYGELFARAREGRTLELRYRCDSPTHRRRHLMRVEPLDGGHIRVSHTLEHSEPRDAPLVVVEAWRGQSLVKRCSVCNAFGRGDEWRDLIDAVQVEGFLDDDRPVRVIHAICPGCRDEMRALSR